LCQYVSTHNPMHRSIQYVVNHKILLFSMYRSIRVMYRYMDRQNALWIDPYEPCIDPWLVEMSYVSIHANYASIHVSWNVLCINTYELCIDPCLLKFPKNSFILQYVSMHTLMYQYISLFYVLTAPVFAYIRNVVTAVKTNEFWEGKTVEHKIKEV
jgi:hypothetical protein